MGKYLGQGNQSRPRSAGVNLALRECLGEGKSRPRRGGDEPAQRIYDELQAEQAPPEQVEGRTFEFSFHLPGNTQHKKKNSKAAGPGRNTLPKTRKNQKAGTGGLPKPEGRLQKPNSNTTSQEISPAKADDTRQDHREYEQARTPERREYHRRFAQQRRQKARELGRCRDCTKHTAIPGQTRCPTCSEAHRQSRRQSDARRRAAAKAMPAAEE